MLWHGSTLLIGYTTSFFAPWTNPIVGVAAFYCAYRLHLIISMSVNNVIIAKTAIGAPCLVGFVYGEIEQRGFDLWACVCVALSSYRIRRRIQALLQIQENEVKHISINFIINIIGIISTEFLRTTLCSQLGYVLSVQLHKILRNSKYVRLSAHYSLWFIIICYYYSCFFIACSSSLPHPIIKRPFSDNNRQRRGSIHMFSAPSGSAQPRPTPPPNTKPFASGPFCWF